MPGDEVLPVVHVRVCVNVDSLRIGYEGEVELTPRIQRLIQSGYLQILGHVLAPVAPEPAPPAVTAPVPVASPTRTRVRKAVDDGAGADPA